MTNQYRTRPDGKLRKRKVNITGINRNILAWVGSAAVGVIFCWMTMVAPMIRGVI